ncbi:MAG TPA: DNA polymerase I [Phycisphaerales bacterium]|nr:DNA polymerase I [Phycisphaerales bacterium]
MPTLYLIDGYAQFFRAYHAIRTPMSSPVTKEPTNMSFGFIGMLLKLLRGGDSFNTSTGAATTAATGPSKMGGKPDYIAVTLDVSGDRGTFRSQLYPDYKAHRPPPPPDLGPQVDRMLDTLKALGVPIIGAEGFEADDVIATLITQLRKQHPDLRIRIVSKDKDLKQLLANDLVELYDVHKDELITAETLKSEDNLTPAQIVDYLALMGDNVDNVPGVEGVGPKTAAQLIAEYGSLDAVLAEAAKPKPKLSGKRLENIRAAAAKLPLSRQLVTLRHDVPIDFNLESAAAGKIKLAELIPILKTLGFNRYQDEVKALLGEPTSTGGVADRSGSTTPASPPGRAAQMGPGAATPPPPPKPKRPAAEPPGGFGGLFDQPGLATTAVELIKPQSGEYRCITSPKELRDLIAELREAECFAIDTETRGLAPLRDALCGICLSAKAGTGVYIPVRSPTPKDHLDEATVVAALKPILEDPAKPKCGHNLKFDMLVLRTAGIRLGGFFTPSSSPTAPLSSSVTSSLPQATVFDSMVASFLIDADRSSHGLDSLALALLGRTNISIKDLIGSGKEQRTFDCVPLDQATQYAAEDADVALQLRDKMLPQLHAMQLWDLFTRVEMPLVEVLAELEWNGIRVDKAELDHQRTRLQKRIDELRTEIVNYTEDHLHRPFNPDSPRQLAAVLFNKPDATEEQGGPGFGLKPIKRIKTGHSTDAEVLEKLAEDPTITNPIPRLIVEHRELTKLVNTYLEALAKEIYPEGSLGGGRIHSSFSQTVAVTGRLASSDPNLQNIPIRTDIGREIRRAFIADKGNVLISADYSQIELRLLAHLSRDPALIQAFHEGQDIHTAVAAQIHGVPLEQVTREQRNGAKMVNFGIVYGITAFGLARRLGISNTAADEIITGYKKRFAGITTFLQECIDHASRFGYVQTMLGRRRPIPDITSSIPARRSFAERTAINSVVQGSAADLIKLAMVELHTLCTPSNRHPVTSPLPARMLLQIHDELVFECPEPQAPEAARQICEIMEHAMQLSVPLKVDVRWATNWFEGK